MSNMPANVRISAQFPFPAGVAGTTPIAITKANGIWSVALPIGALATQNPSGGSLTTDYLLVWDSLTGTYFKMPVSNIPTGPPGPAGPAGPIGPTGGITDAPSDGVNYGRKNAAWNNLDSLYAPIAAADALAYNGMQINGSIDVNQERPGSFTQTNDTFICDGWRLNSIGTMVVVGQQVSALGFNPGLPNILTISTTTAAVSLGASDLVCTRNKLEGFRTERLAWGGSSAQPITIGFWTAHHRTGIYTGSIRNALTNRSYAFVYTQAGADVFQYNVITIPGDTSGTWEGATNQTGLDIAFTVAAGATITAPAANTWSAGNYLAAPGQVNGVAALSDVFRLNGVVVLPGIAAPSAARSPFIMRPFDRELVICKRYWQSIGDPNLYPVLGGQASASTSTYNFNLPHPVPMRAAPTALKNGTWSVTNAGQPAINSASPSGSVINVTATAIGAFNTFPNAAGQNITFDARL